MRRLWERRRELGVLDLPNSGVQLLCEKAHAIPLQQHEASHRPELQRPLVVVLQM